MIDKADTIDQLVEARRQRDEARRVARAYYRLVVAFDDGPDLDGRDVGSEMQARREADGIGSDPAWLLEEEADRG